MLFAAYFGGKGYVDNQKLKELSGMLDIEAAPLLFEGKIENVQDIKHLLDRQSVLGKEAVEGIVVKITHKPSLLPTRYSLRWVNLSENSLKNVTKQSGAKKKERANGKPFWKVSGQRPDLVKQYSILPKKENLASRLLTLVNFWRN